MELWGALKAPRSTPYSIYISLVARVWKELTDPLDIPLNYHRQFQYQPNTLTLEPIHPFRQQSLIFGQKITMSPGTPQVVLDSIQHSHKHLYYFLRLPPISIVLIWPTHQKAPRQVSYTRPYRLQICAPTPIAIIRGRISKHQHQTHDDGEGRHDAGRDAKRLDINMDVDYDAGEESMEGDGDQDD